MLEHGDAHVNPAVAQAHGFLPSHGGPIWSLREGCSTGGLIQQFLQPFLAWLLKSYVASPGLRRSFQCWDLWFSFEAFLPPNEWHLIGANNSKKANNNNDGSNKTIVILLQSSYSLPGNTLISMDGWGKHMKNKQKILMLPFYRWED